MPGLPVHKEVPEKQIIIESDYLRSVWGRLPIFYAKIRQFSKGGECYRHSGYLQSLAPAVPGPSQQPMKPLASCSDHRTFLQTHNCTLMTAECALGEGRAKGKWKVGCSWARLQLKHHLLSCTSPAGRRECHSHVANTSKSSGNSHSWVTNPLGMLPGSPPEPAQGREPALPPQDLPHA